MGALGLVHPHRCGRGTLGKPRAYLCRTGWGARMPCGGLRSRLCPPLPRRDARLCRQAQRHSGSHHRTARTAYDLVAYGDARAHRGPARMGRRPSVASGLWT